MQFASKLSWVQMIAVFEAFSWQGVVKFAVQFGDFVAIRLTQDSILSVSEAQTLTS